MKTLQIQSHPTDTAAIKHRRAAQAYRDQLARLFPTPQGAALSLTSDPLTLQAIYDPSNEAHALWAFFVEDGCPVWDRIALSELALAGLISQRHLL